MTLILLSVFYRVYGVSLIFIPLSLLFVTYFCILSSSSPNVPFLVPIKRKRNKRVYSAAQEVETIGATHWPAKTDTIDGGGRKCGSGEKLATARGERKRRAARCDKAAGWRRWGAGCAVAGRGKRDAGRGVRAHRQSPRRATCLPSVARRLRLCLCDSRRSVHRTRAPITTRAAPLWPRTRPLRYRRNVSPNLSATCYVLTFGHFAYPLPGLFIPHHVSVRSFY